MKQLISFLMAMCVWFNIFAQATSMTIDNQTPGWLSSKINYSDQQTLENLTVTGYINGTDIRFIRELALYQNLHGTLDLSDVYLVVGGDAYYDTYTIKNFNELNSYMFDSFKLAKLILPKSATVQKSVNNQIFGKNSAIDSIIIDCPNMKDIQIFSGNLDVKYVYFGEGIEHITFGNILSTSNKYVGLNEIKLHLPNSFKEVYVVYNVNDSITIYSDIEHPETVIDTENVCILKKGTIYVPVGTTERYKNSIFKNLTIIENVAPNGVIIQPEINVMYVGDKKELQYTITPENSVRNNLTWQSSDNSIATVENGMVEAHSFGCATITATTENNISASCQVNVYEHVTDIALPESLELLVGDNTKLNAQLFPIDKTKSEIEWKSSNSEIAFIDNEGNLKGVSKGVCTITATSTDGGHTADCLVTVVKPVESITISPKSLSLKVGESSTLMADVLPSDASNKNVSWTSSDDSVVKVDDRGNITAISGGEAKIFAAAATNPEILDYCYVAVIQPVTGIYLNESSIEISEDSSFKLIATLLPENATNRKVNWISSDISVAMVSGDGVVYGIKSGEATVMATSEDGGFAALCKVYVVKGFVPVSDIQFDIEKIDGVELDEYQINATITPDNASNKTLDWKSSDNTVATVNSNGLVRLLKKGNAVVAASSMDGSNVKAECMVIVSESTGIENIIADKTTYVKIYDLNGTAVYEGPYFYVNLAPGYYIVVYNGRSVKTIINNN